MGGGTGVGEGKANVREIVWESRSGAKKWEKVHVAILGIDVCAGRGGEGEGGEHGCPPC